MFLSKSSCLCPVCQQIISFLLCLSANHIVSYITAYREAGFLASLSGDQPAGDLIFNKVYYNNGSFYDKQSGVYTVPFDGYYLITEQVLNVTKFLIKIH